MNIVAEIEKAKFIYQINKTSIHLLESWEKFPTALREADAQFFACMEGLYFKGLAQTGDHILETVDGRFHSIQDTSGYVGEPAELRPYKALNPQFVFEIPEAPDSHWQRFVEEYVKLAGAAGKNWFTLKSISEFTLHVDYVLPYLGLYDYTLMLKPVYGINTAQKAFYNNFISSAYKEGLNSGPCLSESAAISVCMAALTLRMKSEGIWA